MLKMLQSSTVYFKNNAYKQLGVVLFSSTGDNYFKIYINKKIFIYIFLLKCTEVVIKLTNYKTIVDK